MGLKALIIDDVPAFAEKLKSQIELICGQEKGVEIDIAEICPNKESGKAAILSQNPDLVFLDIEIPHPGEGFQLIRELTEISFQVIFITGNSTDTYINAYGEINQLLGNSPFRWMTKPVDTEYLRKHILAVAAQHNHSSVDSIRQQGEVFKNNLDKPLEEQFILITGKSSRNQLELLDQNQRTQSNGKAFPLKQVIYLHSFKNYLDMHYLRGEQTLEKEVLRIPLFKAANYLRQTSFCRVHKSHVCNLDWVSSLDEERQELQVNLGHLGELRIPVGPSHLQEVQKRLGLI